MANMKEATAKKEDKLAILLTAADGHPLMNRSHDRLVRAAGEPFIRREEKKYRPRETPLTYPPVLDQLHEGIFV
jgi:hypothetical protein